MVRLKDIAERAGLSINTVSLALRGSPRVSEETRRKIEEIAQALDYLPNHSAKALVSRQTKTIGLLIPELPNTLLTQVAHQVEFELKQHGYVTLLASSGADPEEERRALDTFRARQVDGILAYPTNHQDVGRFRTLRARGMPLVLLAGQYEEVLDVICLDEFVGARMAVQHLIANGHRRIGLLDSSGAFQSNPAKLDGYMAALADAGLPQDRRLVVEPSASDIHGGYTSIAVLMNRTPPPTAVLTGNDPVALGCLKWCLDTGIDVPRDLAIFGYDNIVYGQYASVPISSVRYPADRVARLAVARLLALIEAGEDMPPSEQVRLVPELVLRESTRFRREPDAEAAETVRTARLR